MFELFTDRARRVMQVANSVAQSRNHEYVGPEHILLAIEKEDERSIGPQLIASQGLDRRKVRLEVEKLSPEGQELVTMGKLPTTPATKRLIEIAIAESRAHNHTRVTTGHLIIAIFLEPNNNAGNVLRDLGMTLDPARAKLIELMQDPKNNEDAPVDSPHSGLPAFRIAADNLLQHLRTAIDVVKQDAIPTPTGARRLKTPEEFACEDRALLVQIGEGLLMLHTRLDHLEGIVIQHSPHNLQH